MGNTGHHAQFFSIRGNVEAMADLKIVGQAGYENQLLTIPTAKFIAVFAAKCLAEPIFNAADQGSLAAAFDTNFIAILLDVNRCLPAHIFSEPG